MFQLECPRGTKMPHAHPTQLASSPVFLMAWYHPGFIPPSPFPHPSRPRSVEPVSFTVCHLSIFTIPPPLIPTAPRPLSPGLMALLPYLSSTSLQTQVGTSALNARLRLMPESPGSSKHAESWVSPRHTKYPSSGVCPGNLFFPSSLILGIPPV